MLGNGARRKDNSIPDDPRAGALHTPGVSEQARAAQPVHQQQHPRPPCIPCLWLAAQAPLAQGQAGAAGRGGKVGLGYGAP